MATIEPTETLGLQNNFNRDELSHNDYLSQNRLSQNGYRQELLLPLVLRNRRCGIAGEVAVPADQLAGRAVVDLPAV